MYKLIDIETGLFATASRWNPWSTRGKVYMTIGHMKVRVTANLQRLVKKHIDTIKANEIGRFEWTAEYRKKDREIDQRSDIKDLYDLCYNPKRRKELYEKFMPANWKVVKVAEVIEPVDITIESLFS